MTHFLHSIRWPFPDRVVRKSAKRCYRTFAAYLVLIMSTALSIPSRASAETLSVPENAPPIKVNPSQLKPAMFTWLIDVNDANGGNKMVETVYSASHQGKAVWRVVHRADDPSNKEFAFDMYDVDRTTLKPVRTIYQADQFSRSLDFQGNKVRVESKEADKTSSSEIELPANVMPAEGPGHTLFLAALPLSTGYTSSYYVVDRWTEDEKQRVRMMNLSVQGRETIETPAGKFETFVVVEQPASGKGSKSKHWVLAKAPHYSVRVEYTPTPGQTMLSEVTSLLIAR